MHITDLRYLEHNYTVPLYLSPLRYKHASCFRLKRRPAVLVFAYADNISILLSLASQ